MELKINLKDCIIQMYKPVLKDILNHKYKHYVLAGGRGSTKSSLVGISIPLIIVQNPDVNALCMRKVGKTVQNSVYSQIVWGINKLGLEKYFKIQKVYSNPITFLPTGQQIFFTGTDDPQKIKSIKPQCGYIGATWFEEMDAFTGESELRTILQSTMRGGEKFWDFRTFNPPISKNNWANEYVFDCETNLKRLENTLVVKNTYLDVPVSWLGQAFIDEAEDLKAINPKAYEHEYLGIATGTGGDVFANVSDLDMDRLTHITDCYGNVIKEVPLWQTFDRIYNGIDWGFARDDFRFVKCHFDSKHLDLYVFAEYSTLQTRNEDVFNTLYNEKKLITREELVTADSAEQKSIADFRAFGAFIRGAEKGPESVRYGIKWLQGLRNIYIDKKRCPKTYKEFVNYEYERDREGNFISAYPDKDNHCLTGDTIVNTPHGDFEIKDLVGKTGEIYCYDIDNHKVTISEFGNCRVTFEKAEIWEITLEDDTKICCTYDHPILTSNRGYVIACDLTPVDIAERTSMKIKKVERTQRIEKVYDLEVKKYHNFSVNNGIIVHNSIDATRYALEKYYKKRGK